MDEEKESTYSEKVQGEKSPQTSLSYGCLLVFALSCSIPLLYKLKILCAFFGFASITLYFGGCVLRKTKPENELVKEAVSLGKIGLALNALIGYFIFFEFLTLLRSYSPFRAIQYITIVIIMVLAVYIPLSMIVRKILWTK